MLFDDLDLDDSATHVYDNPPAPGEVLLLPQGERRARAYFVYPQNSEYRLSGTRDVEAFIERCAAAGVPEALLRAAKSAGPLASFYGADNWVTHPYAAGLAHGSSSHMPGTSSMSSRSAPCR
jgi:hypothetical protein